MLVERIDGWIRAAAGRDHLDGLRLARFGDNMRDVAVTEGDKVEAELRFGVSVNTYGVNDLVAYVDAVPDVRRRRAGRRVRRLRTGSPRSSPAAADRHEALRYAARIEAGLRAFLAEGRFGAFTTNFQDLGGLRQLPGLAVQRLMADGYGFGGEGDWKTAALLAAVKEMGGDGERGTSFMEDYTYHFGPGDPKILGAHMLEVCPSIAAATPSCEIHPLGIGGPRGPGPAGVRRRTGSGHGDRHGRPRRPVPVRRQQRRGRAAGRAAAEAAGGPGRVEARADALDLGRAVADRGRTRTTPCSPATWARRFCATSPTWSAPSCC